MLTHTKAQFIQRTACINCGSSHIKELSLGRYADEPLHEYLSSDPWGENPMPYLTDAEWRLVQCADCEQVFHSFILNDEWNERRFAQWMSAEAIREFEHRIGADSPQALFEKERAHVRHVLQIEKATRSIRNGAVKLLDFGCGFGHFVETCRRFGFEAVGVDRSTPRIATGALKILPSLDEASDLAPFHAVTLFEVLEHLDDPSGVLEALSAMMVPGGALVLETPDCSGLTSITDKNTYYKLHPLEHINAFTNATLISIADRAGFSPMTPASAHVTADRSSVLKREIKGALKRGGKSTQLYFSKR